MMQCRIQGGAAPPYFSTKMRTEGLKKNVLGDRAQPPLLI